MRRVTLPRPNYANVVATLALVVAMSGTAYAVNTVGTSDIKDGAVTTPKLADGAVSNAKLAASSVGSLKVVDNALTLADLKGIDQRGTISFSLGAQACGTLILSVSGAVAGQVALLTWTTAPPAGVLFGALQVVSPTQISLRACNETSSSVSVSGAGVRVVTFG